MPSDAASIAVFARTPVPGQAKTRLVPLLGADGAARLQQQLIRQALDKACAVRGASVTLWVAGEPDHPFICDCAGAHDVPVRVQQGADLGARMAAAFVAALGGNRAARCVLIGTDCPSLTTNDLQAAFDALTDTDVAVQPAEDGGYVLIAMNRPHPGLFDDVAWGTSSVMDTTRLRLRTLALRWRELPMRPDLDTPADYAQALAAGWITT